MSEQHRRHDQQQSLRKALEGLSVSAKNAVRRRVSHDQGMDHSSDQHLKVTPYPLRLSSSHSSPTSIRFPKPQYDSPLPSPSFLCVENECRPYSPYDSDFNVSTPSFSTAYSDKSDLSLPSTPRERPSLHRVPSTSSSSGYSVSSSGSRQQHVYSPLEFKDDSTDHDADTESYYSGVNTPTTLAMRDESGNDEPESDNSRIITALNAMERDAYGFKKPTQWVKARQIQQFEHGYRSTLQRQEKKWKAFLAENNGEWPTMSSKLKRYVRKGIPNEIRGRAWMHYSGAKDKMEANPGLFDSLLKTAISMGDHNEYAEIINRDLHRTFPDNTQFACAVTEEDGSVTMDPDINPKLRSLRRILLAFSVYSPQIGYCQSLNYLVGFFILFVESDEEAFWMLVATVHDYFPENMYDVTMEGANIEQTVLMTMIYERMPGIWNKVANGKCFWECEQKDGLPPITLVTSHWFLTLFINIVPVETVLRIWDCFFVEGYKVLFRVALTMVKLNEQKIWALEDPIDIFQILQNMPRRLIDCHRFMESVFSRSSISSDLTLQEIERKRTLFRDRRRQRRAANPKARH